MFDQIHNLDQSMLSTFERLWNFQLFVVEQAPITLGKIIIGILLIILGYFVSRVVSRTLSQKLISRLRIQNSLQYTIERMSFYMVYIFFVLFVLQMLSIPVTIFTVVGSALAIGIGFGSQNVVNNFISGLIVMIEQPIRVGDWIELEGQFGRIEHIGSRSTFMRTVDNKQIIIPNSAMLEKMFVNWTLSDSVVGGRVAVGVTYGSDPQLVKKTLLSVAASHPEVLKDPAPLVLFQDFADSSLNFVLAFSVRLSPGVTPVLVSSDLRFLIEQAFRKAAISMPFPHRQMVFSSESPVRVQIEK